MQRNTGLVMQEPGNKKRESRPHNRNCYCGSGDRISKRLIWSNRAFHISYLWNQVALSTSFFICVVVVCLLVFQLKKYWKAVLWRYCKRSKWLRTDFPSFIWRQWWACVLVTPGMWPWEQNPDMRDDVLKPPRRFTKTMGHSVALKPKKILSSLLICPFPGVAQQGNRTRTSGPCALI